jgi:hypothetical protein
MLVLILLLHMAWEARSLTFACHNGFLVRFGVSRKMKYAALAELEAAGFVAVQRSPGRSPVVTMAPNVVPISGRAKKHEG